ncbi:single-stranded DNA-binding protein [Planctomycetota bacterium]
MITSVLTFMKPTFYILVVIGTISMVAMIIHLWREKENRNTLILFLLYCLISLIVLMCLFWNMFGRGAFEELKFMINFICFVLSIIGLSVLMVFITAVIRDLIQKNKVILYGILSCNPELWYLPDNTPVVQFELATYRGDENKKSFRKGEWDFVDCDALGKTAENINKLCKKGDLLLIEGRYTFNLSTVKNGSKYNICNVRVKKFELFNVMKKNKAGGGEEYSQSEVLITSSEIVPNDNQQFKEA